MSERIRPWLRMAVTALVVAAYAVLAFWCNTRFAPREFGALIAAGPPCLLTAALAWRIPSRVLALTCMAALAALLVLLWPRLREHYSTVMFWEQFSVWALLCANFAVSLSAGRQPLCTVWADRVHGPLTPDVARYTRTVTAAWAVFFACIAAISMALFFLTQVWIWSLFENFATLPLVAAAFILEYWVRRALLPQLRNVSFFAAVRAYSSHR
jgi:uncharacterized membrane protein